MSPSPEASAASGAAGPDVPDPAPRRWGHHQRMRAVAAVAWAGTALLAVLSLWSLAGGLHWSGELLADHRWQLGWTCLFAAGCASAVRAWWASGLLFLLCLGHLRAEMALSLPTQEVFAAGRRIRVAAVSSGWGVEAREALGAWLDEQRPDLALVQRLDPEGLARLDGRPDGAVVAAWPPLEDWTAESVGRALWVRDGVGVESAGGDAGLVDATLRLEGRRLRVVGLRPPHVFDADSAASRDALFEEAARRAAAGDAVVVLGDLGATSYSRAFRDLLATGGLTDSRRGFGRQATWHSDWTPLGFVLATDHVLIGSALRCVARDHHWDLASDHEPVLADLVWADGSTGG